MRVLHILSSIRVQSGVSSYVMNLYKHIDRNLVQFDFLVANKFSDSYEQDILDMGGRIFYMPNPMSLQLFKACEYCLEFFEKHSKEYQVVHLHCPTMALMTIRYAHNAGIPKIIVHSHSSQFSVNKLKQIINYCLVFPIRKYATDFWCCSPEAGDFLFGKNGGLYLPNAIETQRFKFSRSERLRIREKLSIDPNCMVACHVSNYLPLKNIKFLIPVIESLVNAEPQKWRFLFIGEGGNLEEFKQELKKLKLLDNCFFLGLQKNPAPYLKASDIFLLPSIKEGFSIALLEAQTSGLICFTSDSIPKVVDVTGVNYLPLSASVWVNKLLNVTPRKFDERVSCCQKIINSGFDIDLQVKKQLDLYLKD